MYIDSSVSPAGKATRVGGEPGITRAVMSKIQVGASAPGPRAPHTQMPVTPERLQGGVLASVLSLSLHSHECSHRTCGEGTLVPVYR